MILASRSAVFVDALLGHAGVDEGVALQVQKLAPVSFGDPRIAERSLGAPRRQFRARRASRRRVTESV